MAEAAEAGKLPQPLVECLGKDPVKKMLKLSVRWTSVMVLFLCAVSVLAPAEAEPTRIVWDLAHPVTWDLFRGTPPGDAAHRTEAAAIHMTIRWHASYSVSSTSGTNWIGQLASTTVTNTMEPTLSWAVPGKTYASVLDHEQLHFDLNEVYRRKLECLLQETATCSGATQQAAVDLLNANLHQTANVVLQKLSDMQAQYDSQTAHGNNSAEQARWQISIDEWLAAPTTAP
ncbi:hypothetical protein ACFLSW_05710 [Candidatus Bipolaricaulota bacterium]